MDNIIEEIKEWQFYEHKGNDAYERLDRIFTAINERDAKIKQLEKDREACREILIDFNKYIKEQK